MKFLSRLAGAAAFCAAIASAPTAAFAQYPERPVKLIVPYAAGGTVDVFARLIAPDLEAKIGKPVIIENIQGAGGAIGVARAVRAPNDGYTILMGIVSDVVLAPLTEPSAGYTYRDLEPIGPLGTSGLGIVANPALKIRNLSELIAYAKKNPGKVSYGATGAGSLPALAMEDFKRRAKVEMNFIPYASASKIAVDVMGGHLDVGVSGLPALLEHIKGGKLAGVGVLSKDRDLGNKDMISAGETPELKGADFFFWTGLFAPKGTAAPIVNKLNVAFAEVLKEQKVRSRFADLGVKISEPVTPQVFGAFVAQSNAQYEQLVKQSGTPKN
ncbi:MAG: tripartite tricarboxylate transporter substrate binding protein [Comamonadaceae bacterium]|nr:MAG: tripartite tricarboxylate transporter substrate binding protein [Comamonadaceae bacterium]